MSWPDPPLERSLWAVDPLDEFASVVGDWIWKTAHGKEHVEIEAKIGKLIDNTKNERIVLPVLNESIIDIQDLRFESDLSAKHHAKLNQILNKALERTHMPGFTGVPITHVHSIEDDMFYNRVRVTKDRKTGALKPGACIIKKRIADLHVYCANRPYDYRISINVELPASIPDMSGPPQSVRHKDRVSYQHQEIQVDLTQVFSQNSDQPSHELEVEFRNADKLLEVGRACGRGSAGPPEDWTPYDDSVLVFLNNIRMLIRNSAPTA